MKKSSDMYKQIVLAQKAMKKWPKELKRGLIIIPIEDLKNENPYLRNEIQV